VPDLALSDQLLHSPSDVLDRNIGIDAVLIEQVNAVGLQAPEGCLGHLPDVLRAAVQPAALSGIRADVEVELGGYDDLVADWGEGLTEELLVDERPVGFGGVEERDPSVGCSADQRDAVVLVRWLAVVHAQAHAAKSQGGDLKAAKGAGLHCAHPRGFPSIGLVIRLAGSRSRRPGRPVPRRRRRGP
jgi:hypothetical protein